MNLENANYYSFLLDFYGSLLTKKQYDATRMFLFDNLGITEISGICGITKQATNDILKRTQKLLDKFEKELKIFDKYTKSKNLIVDEYQKKEFIKIWEK